MFPLPSSLQKGSRCPIFKGNHISVVVAMPVKVPSSSKSRSSEGLALLLAHFPIMKRTCPLRKGDLTGSFIVEEGAGPSPFLLPYTLSERYLVQGGV